jgi:sugar phosphate isomerase/epimerase
VAAIGYRDIELPGLMDRAPADLRRAADGVGLAYSSVHLGLTGKGLNLGDAPQKVADVLGALGAKQVVVPMFPMPPTVKLQPGDSFGSAVTRGVKAAGEDMWKQLAEQLNQAAAGLKSHGVAVGYHNHSVEFLPIGERSGWEILAGETDPGLVHFEADIGWIVSAGLDPIAFFKRYSGRVRQVHVKDVAKGFIPAPGFATAPAEVGSGQIDWARVLPAAYAAGARHFYVEQEPPFAMPRMESVAKSYAYLAQLRA